MIFTFFQTKDTFKAVFTSNQQFFRHSLKKYKIIKILKTNIIQIIFTIISFL